MKMTVSGLGPAYYAPHYHLRYPLSNRVPMVRFFSAIAAVETLESPERVAAKKTAQGKNGNLVGGDRRAVKWKKVHAEELGIRIDMISRPTRKVLDGLKRKGYDVYLVGGCVRDIILKRTPKDFDVITTAELWEVRRAFSRCEIVGRRFPICHVHIKETFIEVSSFCTNGRKTRWDRSYDDMIPVDCDEKDYARWRNCLQRDFTINGLLYDPYADIVYDYVGGLEDLKKAKVQTVIAASVSFQEDCARILRGIRIASRLGFRLSKETANAVTAMSSSILKLDKARLTMELNYMLSYGSAEASLRTLWKLGLLEILLPIQAAYFVRNGFKRRDKGSNMLLSLFSTLDKLLAPDRPCHSSLWVGLLAFHEALAEQPRHPHVIAAFCLAVHNGGDIGEAVNIARRITRPSDHSFYELAHSRSPKSNSLIREVKNLVGCINQVLDEMTDESCVAKAMSEYPKAPFSDLVLISFTLHTKVQQIFECIVKGKGSEPRFVPKHGQKIDYDQLAWGALQEVRHVFARVIFDTMYPVHITSTRTEDLS